MPPSSAAWSEPGASEAIALDQVLPAKQDLRAGWMGSSTMRMHSAHRVTRAPERVPVLRNGDRMRQPEFHRRYESYPDKGVIFELIGGTVYMASPLSYPHGRFDSKLSLVFGLYEAATPGVEVAGNATVILGEESEPQPDATLRLTEDSGGRSRINDDEYIEGAPELLTEIAYSSRSIDMNQKREDYQKAGVVEYLVLCIEDREVHWFDFQKRSRIRRGRDGVARSRVFPGLWIDVQALLDRNAPRLIEVVQQGIASPAHAAFVRKLERARGQS
jgi:Putative restriction endonuclease